MTEKRNLRQRDRERRLHGYLPKPTVATQCLGCDTRFVPFGRIHKYCSKQCRWRHNYKTNPRPHLEKAKRLRAKHGARLRAKERMTWAQMREQRGADSPYMKGRYPWIPLLSAAKHRAAKTNKDFNLTREWCEQRWTGNCELTKLPFILNTFRRNGFSPSIDRIDSTKGYTQDNCRFILWCVNAFKITETDADIYRVAEALLASR